MLIGAVGAMVFMILFLSVTTTQTTGYDTLVAYSVGLAVFLSVTFTPWMAAYTESVEAKNPALVGTGLALWGWLLRLVVAASFIFLPVVVNAVNPIIDNQPVATPQIQAFLANHKESIAFATTHKQLLKVISENQAVVNAVATRPVADQRGGGHQCPGGGQLRPGRQVQDRDRHPGRAVPGPAELPQRPRDAAQRPLVGVGQVPREWQHWFWVCFGGMVLFVPTIFLARGRWSPKRARQDKAAHEEAVSPRAGPADRDARAGRHLGRLAGPEPGPSGRRRHPAVGRSSIMGP